MIKVFYCVPDENNLISFSTKELEQLLKDVYQEGYEEGKKGSGCVSITSVPYPYSDGISTVTVHSNETPMTYTTRATEAPVSYTTK